KRLIVFAERKMRLGARVDERRVPSLSQLLFDAFEDARQEVPAVESKSHVDQAARRLASAVLVGLLARAQENLLIMAPRRVELVGRKIGFGDQELRVGLGEGARFVLTTELNHLRECRDGFGVLSCSMLELTENEEPVRIDGSASAHVRPHVRELKLNIGDGPLGPFDRVLGPGALGPEQRQGERRDYE